jgi:hypothetical protein
MLAAMACVAENYKRISMQSARPFERDLGAMRFVILIMGSDLVGL